MDKQTKPDYRGSLKKEDDDVNLNNQSVSGNGTHNEKAGEDLNFIWGPWKRTSTDGRDLNYWGPILGTR